MDYTVLKKYTEAKLTELKEELVRSVNIPSNTISYTGANGAYIINPFGPNSYSFDVIFDRKECFENFVKEFPKTKIYDEVEADINVSDDGIHNHFVIKGFVNKALVNDLQTELKNILNSYEPKKALIDPTTTKLGAMK